MSHRIRQAFLLLLGLTYIGLGIFIYIRDVIPVKPWSQVMAALFVGYGLWRSYRALKQKPSQHSA